MFKLTPLGELKEPILYFVYNYFGIITGAHNNEQVPLFLLL